MSSLLRSASTTLAAALFVCLGTAHAQDYSRIGTAKIPFSFEWSGMHFAAGQYTMSRNGAFVLVNDGTVTKSTLPRLEIDRIRRHSAQIVFHCVARQCFLREIWPAVTDNHLVYPPLKAEAEATKRLIAEGAKPAGDNIVLGFE